MNRKTTLIAWILSALVLAIAAGSIWKSIELSPEVGASLLEVTGFDVYPIAGALVLLQLAALAVVSLIATLPGRLIQATVSISSIVMFLYSVSDWSSQTLKASELAISNAIGISGSASQEQYISAAEVTVWPVIYLIGLLFNAAIVFSGALNREKVKKGKSREKGSSDTDDLWESQKA